MGSSELMETAVASREEQVPVEYFSPPIESASLTNTLRHKTYNYWVASQAWNGHSEFAPKFNIGQLLHFLAGLRDLCQSQSHNRLQTHICGLLDRVVRGKRCRKTKRLPNVANISDAHLLRERRAAKRQHITKQHQRAG